MNNQSQFVYSPRMRNKVIDIACNNLVKAGMLLPCGVEKYLALITRYSDDDLGNVLAMSLRVYKEYLVKRVNLN